MKLLSVRLENIFAYHGRCEIDLSITSPERNIILIWGRNGYGKTSFLNAVKLLFTGADDPRFRTVGYPGTQLSMPEFVLGKGSHWLGLVNRHAQRRSAASLSASVGVTLDVGGRRVRADRTWVVENGRISEQLVVFDGENRLTGNPAEEELENILPKDFASFFFFDGEAIKSMAESIEQKTIPFDRLLRLTFLTDAAEELTKAAQERFRRGLESDVLRELGQAEGALLRAQREHQADEKSLAETEDQLVTDETELRRLQTRRENLASGASEAQRADLERRRQELGEELAELRAKIVEGAAAEAPLLANLRLVEAALRSADQRIASASSAEVVLVGQIREQFPDWVSEALPELTQEQQLRLRQTLDQRLQGLVRTPAAEGLLGRLDIGRAERLRAALVRWWNRGPDRRSLHAAQLQDAARMQMELEQVGDALMRIEVGSQANLEEYRKVMEAISSLEPRVAELNQRKGQLIARLEEKAELIRRLEEDLENLRASKEQASRNAGEARAIQKIAKTLNDLREAYRRQSRAKLEQLINQRFATILSGHELIERIELDDEYTLFFVDSAGEPIGRASLSSGMKQLAATALLWAMKDAAAVGEMPVIIDTPLGRIDRTNQDNLLNHYYPYLSEQVIILPTDAEIDARKRDLLSDYIAEELRIDNPSGDRAEIRKESMLGAR